MVQVSYGRLLRITSQFIHYEQITVLVE